MRRASGGARVRVREPCALVMMFVTSDMSDGQHEWWAILVMTTLMMSDERLKGEGPGAVCPRSDERAVCSRPVHCTQVHSVP
jgi:hypothetical protein